MEEKEVNIIKPSILNENEFMEQNFPEMNIETEGLGFIHWEIENWSQLDEKSQSKSFEVAGTQWNILLYPQGNRTNERVSIYLEYSDAANAPEGWHSCAQFILAISSIENPELSFFSTAHHRFNAEEADWGFTNFVEIRSLVTPNSAGMSFLSNDSIRISAFVKLAKDKTGVLWHNFLNWDSRRETGFVGFKNQGATCYMNSLLQAFYFTSSFRRAVFQIPTEHDNPKTSIPLALQRIFYNLQASPTSVGTTELTSSFGWDSVQSFMQHDVQEFNRVLQDNLETKMKGTAVDGAIANLFEGKMKSYIDCVNVDYVSSRIENYYDISLNVKGNKTLYDSFVDYCQVELLDGDNKYMAEGYGLQAAKKGVIFESFPPVLQLHLKRFEYDFAYDNMVKINDRYEFPGTIDLSAFLSKDADMSEPWEYELHSVLVHSGDLHSGHYFACIRTSSGENWYKFDDDNVIPVSEHEVFEDNFGGEYPHPQGRKNDPRAAVQNPRQAGMRQNRLRYTNAYMLIYFRKSRLAELLEPITMDMIPRHLIERNEIAKEEEERKSREKSEMHLYTNVAIITDDHFRKNQGFDIANIDEFIENDSHFITRVRKGMALSTFISKLADELKTDKSSLRLWSFFRRYNGTIRIDSPIFDPHSTLTMGQIQTIQSSGMMVSVVYCENIIEKTVLTPSNYFNFSEENNKIIHIKFYDPYTKSISGLDKIFVNENTVLFDMVPYLLEMKGLPLDSSIIMYEEVYPGNVNKLDITSDIKTVQIVSGDLIVFQLEPTQDEIQNFKQDEESLLYAPEYFDHIRNCVQVTFCQLNKNEDNNSSDSDDLVNTARLTALQQVDVKLYLTQSYTSVAKVVAEKIGVSDPEKLRFLVASESGMPRQAVSNNPATKLSDMLPLLNTNVQNSPQNLPDSKDNLVFFEILDVSLDQLEKFRKISVTYLGKTMKDTRSIDVLVSKTSDCQELIEAIYFKVSNIMALSHSTKNSSGNPPSSPLASSGKIDSSPVNAKFSSPPPFGLRVYEVVNNRISRLLAGNELISSIAEYGSSIVAELTPSCTDYHYQGENNDLCTDSGTQVDIDESKKTEGSDGMMEQGEISIEVFNFNKDVIRTYGIPFSLKVFPNEPFYPDTWLRIKQKLGATSKEFENIRPALIPYSEDQVPHFVYLRLSNSENSPSDNPSTISGVDDNTITKSAEHTDDPALPPYSSIDEFTNNASLEYLMSQDNVCLYDLVKSSKDALGLDHIDRSSRSRAHHTEASIKILN